MSTTLESQHPSAPSTALRARGTLARSARRRLFAVLATLLLGAFVSAQGVVVHPFGGQDLELGAAVAERATHALRQAQVDVYGPELAPTLIPPLVVANGFINPAVFLGAAGIDSPTGADLLRQSVGATIAVTGFLELQDDRIVLEMYLSVAGGSDEVVTLQASEDAPERLATGVARTIARAAGASRPAEVDPFELTGGFGDYARAITAVGAGFAVEARNLLRDAPGLPPEGRELLADLEAAIDATDEGDPARSAIFALSVEDFRDVETIAAFERFVDARDLPAARTWLAVLAASTGDDASAEATFDVAGELYPYGAASRLSYLQARVDDSPSVTGVLQTVLETGRFSGDTAALLAASIIAENAEAPASLKRALHDLSRAAPYFTYPFERLSFIAFDEDEPLDAAEALVVAVELEPDSDLYWTNLGWAYYLLGFLERSEIASERAIGLDPSQYIARYNLGLAHAVRDDLAAAMPEYNQALQYDPGVDDEAVADLENALSLYPDAPAVHYALGFLYAADGRRSEAADQYEAYLADSEARDSVEPVYAERARRQLSSLRAPPSPLEISAGAQLVLGASGEQAAPYHPADPLTPQFELYTPGSSLPQRVEIFLSILGPDGETVSSATAEVAIPTGAIGYVVDDLRVELPAAAPAGTYRFEIRAEASEDRSAVAELDFSVAGEAQALRRLLGRGIVMQSLEGGASLYGSRDLVRAERLPEILVNELRARAEAASGAIPVIPEGPFEGLDGGALFRDSTEEDVVAFLDYLFAQDVFDTAIVFAEAYASWAVDGAPRP